VELHLVEVRSAVRLRPRADAQQAARHSRHRRTLLVLKDTEEETIQAVKDRIEVEFLTSTGMDNMEALLAVFNDRIEAAKKGGN
jgi:hypothetical protein